MYTLYGGGFTRAHLTEMVFTEIDQPFKVVEVDTTKGAHLTADYLALNPTGRVPALITPEGDTLYETQAINLYLIDRHTPGGLAPAPNEVSRGQFLSGLFYLNGEVEPALKRYFFPQRTALRLSDVAAIRKQSLADVCAALSTINQRLEADGPYHLGARFSLVDLVLAYWIYFIMDQAALAEFDAINRCAASVAAQPKLKPMFDAHKDRASAYALVDKEFQRQNRSN